MSTIHVNGVDLFVKESGAGPPVLLIHGTGIDADTWGAIYDDLARDHRVIAYDRRGFSRSGPEGATPDWKRHSADAAALLREMEAAPATVVGWSAGGIIAYDLAVSHPELVSTLVTFEAALHGVKHPSLGFMRTFVAAQVLGRVRGPEAAVDRFMHYTCGFREGGHVWDEYPADRKAVLYGNGRSMLRELNAAGRDRHLTAERLGGLRMPVTIAYGARTQPWFERCAKAAAKLVPTARLQTIPGGNHALAYTAPEATAALVREAAAATGHAPPAVAGAAPAG